jgi:Ca2+:H+ antiporter
MHVDGSIVFLFTCLGIVPLSALIGDSTEQIALYSGPKIGGLVNATMGNVPELLIGIFAVKAGLYSLVLASLAGSIMGNTMLVLGFSVLLGGMKYKFQSFNMSIARSNLTMLAFAGIGIILPFVFKITLIENGKPIEHPITMLSFFIAILMLIVYLLGLVFSLITHRNFFIENTELEEGEGQGEKEKPSMSLLSAVLLLTGATVFVAIESEILVATVEDAIAKFHLSETFVGIIVIPILGNVAEHASAMMMAVKNKIDLSIEIAVGSSMQIALFVAPVLVVLSFILGNPIAYVYNAFEIAALVSSIVLAIYIFISGKTNWMEGLLLIISYVTLGVAFFYI